MYNIVKGFVEPFLLVVVARVAQWLERRAQRYDDHCVGGSNPTVGRGCRSFG
jgi:hypothetical protein